ncbi:hypothetical protein [Embleya sp. AB8]|uniref:hypothetical protein n=1 Tax=Embleya sp. AB8 TaxID=3156304 RepID=UPI003C729851
MAVTASFTDEEVPDGHIRIRRFDNEAQRVEFEAAVHDGDHWNDVIDPVVKDLSIPGKSVATRAAPAPCLAPGRPVLGPRCCVTFPAKAAYS